MQADDGSLAPDLLRGKTLFTKSLINNDNDWLNWSIKTTNHSHFSKQAE